MEHEIEVEREYTVNNVLSVGEVRVGEDLDVSITGKEPNQVLNITFPNDYNKLVNKPFIPSKTDDIENNSGFITNKAADLENYYDKTTIDGKLSTKADASDIPDVSSFITKSVNNLDNYYNKDNAYNKSQVDSKLDTKANSTEIPDVSSFITKEVNNLDNYYDKNKTDELLGNKQPAGDYALKSEIPDVSSFITNEVDDLGNYYKKSETYTQVEIDNMIQLSNATLFYWDGKSSDDNPDNIELFQRIVDTSSTKDVYILANHIISSYLNVKQVPIMFYIPKGTREKMSELTKVNCLIGLSFTEHNTKGVAPCGQYANFNLHADSTKIITNVSAIIISSGAETNSKYFLPSTGGSITGYNPTSIHQPANIKYVNDYVDEQVGNINSILETLFAPSEEETEASTFNLRPYSVKVTGTDVVINEEESEDNVY